MNRHSRFCVLLLLTVVMSLSIPHLTQAQPSSVKNQAILDAQRDAQAAFDERLWFYYGCIFTVVGYFSSELYYAPVPSVPLLGRSPEYVAYYTDTYRAKSRELRSEAAFRGCLQGSVAQFCLPPILGVVLATYQ